jgi:drug/metabolite transporter (DMT)-like permease
MRTVGVGTDGGQSRLSPNGPSERGAWGAAAALMVSATLCFVILDSILKHLAESGFGIGMLVTVRNLVQVLALAALAPLIGRSILRPRRLGLNAARGLSVVLATVFITLSLTHLPMAQTYAVTFSAPLIAAVLASLLLGERAGWRRWLCILAGFGGVLVALDPGGVGLEPALFYPLAMAAANAAFHVLTRLGRDEDPLAMSFWSGAAAFAICAAALPWTFDPLPLPALALLGIGGLVGTAAHVLVAQAFRRAPIALVSPMIYSQIVWASLVGFLAFGERPTAAAVLGAAIVTASGVALVRWANPPAAKA